MPAAGDYQISYAYWPRHFTISLWVSAIGLAAFLSWMAIAYRRSKA
jgi:hypothetical protein